MKSKYLCLFLSIGFINVVFAKTDNININKMRYADNSTNKNTQNDPDVLDFEELEVSGKELKNEEKPFTTPGATSSREISNTQTQSIDSVVRSMAGTYTNTDQSQGTVQVNVRGMTGFGRVNTMIDGVSQTFFGGSSDSGRVHGGTVSTQAFGAPVDPSFLVGVDVTRGGFSGASGGNSLMGSANFKTIGVDDVVSPENTYGGISLGVLSRLSYGTNGIGPAVMASTGLKFKPHGDESSLGFLFAYSYKHIKQNYRVGGGGNIGDSHDSDGDGIPDAGTEPFNPALLTQEPQGYLFKTEYQYNPQNTMSLIYRKYLNSLAGRDINSDTYQLNYEYKPHFEFVNINVLLAYTHSLQKYNKGALIFGNNVAQYGLTATNNAFSFDVNNKMMTNFFNINYKNKIGFSTLINQYQNTISEEKIGSDSVPFQPKGLQTLFTLYLDNILNYDIYELSFNTNVTRWDLIGHRGPCEDYTTHCFPKNATNVNNGGFYFNVSTMFSAKVHDLFSPFVSYARSNRAPNVQEMFFSNNQGNSINPFLKPETADTYQIGFNGLSHGLITNDDTLGYKLLYYYSDVKNFMYLRSFLLDGTRPDSQVTMFVNFDEFALFHGIEFELNYDMKYFFTKIAYSWQKTKQPMSEGYAAGSQGFGYGRLAILPEDYATIDLGIKLFDEKLIIGSIIKYTGEAKRMYPDDTREENPSDPNDIYGQLLLQKLPKIPTIWDFYITYNPWKYFGIRFEIQNMLDENYMDALNAYNSLGGQYGENATNGSTIYLFNNAARGRTYVLSMQLKW